jgi:hypothetical protein
VFLGACNQGPVELDVELPSLPEPWIAAFGTLGYELAWRGPSGTAETVVVDRWDPGRTGPTVVLAAGGYAPVTVTPVGPAPQMRLPPAGGVFPLDVDPVSGALCVSFRQGPAARLLAQLLGSAANLEPGSVDVERLAREIQRIGADDPWSVDLRSLMEALLGQDPDHARCTRLPALPVSIPAAELPDWPEATVFVLDNPLAASLSPPPQVDGEPRLVAGDLAVGLHRLFSCSPEGVWMGTWLDLGVSRSEVVWIGRPRSREALD